MNDGWKEVLLARKEIISLNEGRSTTEKIRSKQERRVAGPQRKVQGYGSRAAKFETR